MNLRLRDLLADSCLAALSDATADPPLLALAAFAERADATGRADGLTEGQAHILASTDCFETTSTAVRLVPDLVRDLPAFRERARRLVEAVAESRARCGPVEACVSWSLCAASALFDAGLFFEVHELLEGWWRSAAEDLKTFLQGLIQVAVGLHHQANGNVRGALSLLAEGNEKLRRFRPAAHGVELEDFCTAVERIEQRLRAAPGAAIEIPRLVARQSPSSRMR